MNICVKKKYIQQKVHWSTGWPSHLLPPKTCSDHPLLIHPLRRLDRSSDHSPPSPSSRLKICAENKFLSILCILLFIIFLWVLLLSSSSSSSSLANSSLVGRTWLISCRIVDSMCFLITCNIKSSILPFCSVFHCKSTATKRVWEYEYSASYCSWLALHFVHIHTHRHKVGWEHSDDNIMDDNHYFPLSFARASQI